MKHFRTIATAACIAAVMTLCACSSGKGQTGKRGNRETEVSTASSESSASKISTDEIAIKAEAADTQATEETLPDLDYDKEYEIGSYGGEAIKWKIHNVSEGKVLLLAVNAIDGRPYNDTDEDVTWETCSLRKWLNGDFYMQAFTPEEQGMIIRSTVNNKNNPYESEDYAYGNDTEDYVFILSTNEIMGNAVAYPTKYAQSRNVSGTLGGCNYWVRTPGHKAIYSTDSISDAVKLDHAAYSDYKGLIFGSGADVNKEGYGVRPAMWVDASKLK